MTETAGESGLKWWLRYVIVPLLGGGGVVAILISQNGRKHKVVDPNPPSNSNPITPAQIQSAASQPVSTGSNSGTGAKPPSDPAPTPVRPDPTPQGTKASTVACVFRVNREKGVTQAGYAFIFHQGILKLFVSDGGAYGPAQQQDEGTVSFPLGSTQSVDLEYGFVGQVPPGQTPPSRVVLRQSTSFTVSDPCKFSLSIRGGNLGLQDVSKYN
jgi:hypothetical protein